MNSRLAGTYNWIGCCGKEENLCPSKGSNPANPACGLAIMLTFTKCVNEKIKIQPESHECKLVSGQSHCHVQPVTTMLVVLTVICLVILCKLVI